MIEVLAHDSIVAPLQLAGLEQQISNVIGSILAFVPVLIAAIVILVVGLIVGRVLGGIVTRLLQRIGLSQYARGTPLEGSGDGGFESALGTLVSYYVYFVTVLAAANVLQLPILSQLLSELGAFLPTILGALVVLVIGLIVGRVVGDLIGDLVNGLGFSRFLRGTPLQRFSDREGQFGNAIGLLVSYYIYFLTVLTASNILDITVLSELLSRFASYIPTLIAGLVILFVGVLVAEFVGDMVSNTDNRQLTSWLGTGVKVFVYYLTATLALETIGFETTVLTNLFNAFVIALFGGLGLAVAIGLGIGIGYGSRDYIAQNIDRWAGGAREAVSGEEQHGTGSGSGVDYSDD